MSDWKKFNLSDTSTYPSRGDRHYWFYYGSLHHIGYVWNPDSSHLHGLTHYQELIPPKPPETEG